jgi:magnesium chelatase family protein
MGTGFDLPIALAILEAFNQIPEKALESDLIIGELSLDGKITPIPGILAIAMAAEKAGIKKVIVPCENGP